jgi:hypothetical protein
MGPSRRVLPSALALAAAGSLFAPQPLAHLAWLALVAPALGVIAARALPILVAAALPLAWLAPFAAQVPGTPPAPLWGWCVAAGLYAAGFACGTLARANVWGLAGGTLLATLCLSLAPARGAYARGPWPPDVARALLELSPTALALESAGVDWMRHATVYEPVGTDRFERRARRGALAGPTLLLVGCLSAAAAQIVSRRLADRAARAPGA